MDMLSIQNRHTAINNHRFTANIIHACIQTLNTMMNPTYLSSQQANDIHTMSHTCEDEIRSHIRNMLCSYSQKWNISQDILMVNLCQLFTILSRSALKDFIIQQKEKLYELSIREWFQVLEFYLQMNGMV